MPALTRRQGDQAPMIGGVEVTATAAQLNAAAATAAATAIADVPTAGSATAAANATAINSMLAVLRARGFVAP
jgi:hypothetical protein